MGIGLKLPSLHRKTTQRAIITLFILCTIRGFPNNKIITASSQYLCVANEYSIMFEENHFVTK